MGGKSSGGKKGGRKFGRGLNSPSHRREVREKLKELTCSVAGG
jgi:hypothetical protein